MDNTVIYVTAMICFTLIFLSILWIFYDDLRH